MIGALCVAVWAVGMLAGLVALRFMHDGAPDAPWVGTGRDGNDPPPGFTPPTSVVCGWCGRRVRDTAELHDHPCTHTGPAL